VVFFRQPRPQALSEAVGVGLHVLSLHMPGHVGSLMTPLRADGNR
jgi:hypothetical protein